ncbi:MAG: hypothetical protein JWP06_294 [Candidatus Saccharibacteria bacterium]|nr:hypothetical protein [Candidatus Saccharibacteria bacterium]
MTHKELVVVNLFLGVLIVFFGLLTLGTSLNQSPLAMVANAIKNDTAATQAQLQNDQIKRCNKASPLLFPEHEDDPHLIKLKVYQDMCQSFVTDTLMVFTGFPQDATTAEADATVMAKKLILLSTSGIKPIVVAEPYATSGAVSYRDFINGKYDLTLQIYFEKIHDLGVTDKMMGTWVPFPESNTPNWNNKDTEPHDFALCVNKYLSAYKKQFPSAQGSILLNATTYDPNDLEYDNGDYLDLTPYVQDINKSLVSSLGIQGFPWISNATVKRRDIFRASEFLQPDLAISAARELRTRNIWFNTGSFARKYTNDPAKLMTVSNSDRKAILSGILETANSVQDYQQNNYRVSINLFSEDKSDTTEATDWSYFQNDDSKTILRYFLSEAQNLDIPISIYDKSK